MQVLTLDALRDVFRETEKTATPHRTPNFKQIAKLVDGDTEVKGRMWLFEEHNTGYDGILERWSFTVQDKTGKSMTFWADLLPGKVSTGQGPIITPEMRSAP